MTASKAIQAVSDDGRISVRVLLTVVGILVTVLLAVAGFGLAAVIQFSSMRAQVDSMSKDMDAWPLRMDMTIKQATDSTQRDFSYQVQHINEELQRRTADRFSLPMAIRLQAANQKALREAGVEVELPDVYSLTGSN